MVTIGETLAILNQEIQWALDHPAPNLNRSFQKGFVSGLQQAINLITAARTAGDDDADNEQEAD